MKKGTRVKLKATSMTIAWNKAGEVGVVVGPDPSGCGNKNVVAVKLDSGSSIFELKGIHVDHLEVAK